MLTDNIHYSESQIFALLKQRISEIQMTKNVPIRIAINGIEGTGKTIFTERLSQWLSHQKPKAMKPIHVSIDGFHFNKERRYRQGRDSAKGYYEDAYNEEAFVEKVLLRSQSDPFEYIPATHSLETDQYIDVSPVSIPANAVLLVDGAYLLKPIYNNHWDLRLYLKTDFETAQKRGVSRDASLLGGDDIATQKFTERYHAASRLYLEDVDPIEVADIIVDNTDFNALRILKM